MIILRFLDLKDLYALPLVILLLKLDRSQMHNTGHYLLNSCIADTTYF